MIYEPWQQRLLEEASQLNDRLSKLRTAIKNVKLTSRVLDQLSRQERVMQQYQEILDERIADFKSTDSITEAARRGFEGIQHGQDNS